MYTYDIMVSSFSHLFPDLLAGNSANKTPTAERRLGAAEALRQAVALSRHQAKMRQEARSGQFHPAMGRWVEIMGSYDIVYHNIYIYEIYIYI